MNKLQNILIVIFIFTIANCNSQSLHLFLKSKDSIENSFLKKFKNSSTFPNKISIDKEISKIHKEIKEYGYLKSNVDLIRINDNTYEANFYLGKLFKDIHLKYNQSIDFNKYNLTTKYKITNNTIRINFSDIVTFLNELVVFYNDNGNAMAEVSLNNIILKKEKAYANLIIQENKNRVIDKFVFNGYDRFPKNIKENILKPFLNKPFNKKNLTLISNSIKTLNFVEEIKKPAVLFTNDSTLIYIYLKKKRSNRFDGLIGFNSKETGKGVELNGNIDLQLNNIFNKGESFTFFWNSNSGKQKKININSRIPFIFKSPISTDIVFLFFNRDASFIQIKPTIKFDYAINSNHSIIGNFNFDKSTTLNQHENNTSLKDYTSSFYGIGYQYNKSMNTNRNLEIKFIAEAGIRDDSESTIAQKKINLKMFYGQSINNKASFSLQTISSNLISNNYLTNELFRIGGKKSIRGFQEESVNASKFNILQTEFKYKTNDLSYLYSITDVGLIENKIINNKSHLFSFGFGYAFTIKNGMLNMSYSIGKLENEPFNFNKGLIHFEIISFF
ncbi:MAG: ShlB/FhaC/HecB family hemolysin secretion/activation protein [Flavobacteriaceae bacterium]